MMAEGEPELAWVKCQKWLPLEGDGAGDWE